ncbi:hypothetical protein [Brevibacillus choshinensis]|uniref:hypothetical protein n=1 Tax=Brevibacillus choshinensis TaxID=54911 RepID=UPI002E1C9041|nr:hypothetical protein [Brevibacillus choshinensis]
MLDFGAVSIEWGTLAVQLLFFLMFFGFLIAVILLIVECTKRVGSRNKWNQQSIKALEKRVAALEEERDRPKQ